MRSLSRCMVLALALLAFAVSSSTASSATLAAGKRSAAHRSAKAAKAKPKAKAKKHKATKHKAKAKAKAKAAAPAKGNVAAGAKLFASTCSVCHGVTGMGGEGGPDLKTQPLAQTTAGVIKQVTHGGGGMPAFGGTFSKAQIADIAAFVTEKIVK